MTFKQTMATPIPLGVAYFSVGMAVAGHAMTFVSYMRDMKLAKELIANRDQAIAIQNEALKILMEDPMYPPHPTVMAKVNDKLDFWRVIQEQNIVDGEEE